MRELIDHYKNECKVNLSFITFSLCMQNNPQLSNMEFGRRLAVERELEKTDYFSLPNACKKMYTVIKTPYTYPCTCLCVHALQCLMKVVIFSSLPAWSE